MDSRRNSIVLLLILQLSYFSFFFTMPIHNGHFLTYDCKASITVKNEFFTVT